MPIDGKLAVFWGDKGENEIVLGPLDTITVPIGVMRGFRNVDNKTIQVIAIVGGDDGGRLTWHKELVDGGQGARRRAERQRLPRTARKSIAPRRDPHTLARYLPHARRAKRRR